MPDKHNFQINGNGNSVNNVAIGKRNVVGQPAAQPKAPVMLQTKLFISYRRAPSRGFVEALYNHLGKFIEKNGIFLDVKSLGGGSFPENLQKAVTNCDIFLSVISTGTFDRINEPEDWVRKEIATALRTERKVVLVLEDDIDLPNRADLPTEIQPLLNFNGIRIRYDLFEASVEQLVNRLIRPLITK